MRDLRGVRVLVVEDDTELRQLFELLLSYEGADVEAAASGAEAAAMVRGGAFDLVLSDLMLPDIPGDVLIRHIRAMRSDVRVAVITGSGDPHVSRARDAGADMVFHKPIGWDVVIDYVRGVPGTAAPTSLSA